MDGKTTLLEIIAGNKILDQGLVARDASITLLPQLKEAKVYQSGGETTQSYIDKALAEKADLLLADESTTNLDTAGIEKLEKALHRFQGACILVSHDRTFLDALCETIWEIEEGISVSSKSVTQENDNRRLVIDNKLTEVLGKLSVEPTEQ